MYFKSRQEVTGEMKIMKNGYIFEGSFVKTAAND